MIQVSLVSTLLLHISLTLLIQALLILAPSKTNKSGHKKCRKLSKQVNILGIYIKEDINIQLFKYPISREKKIAGLLIKDVFKVFISKEFVNSDKFVAISKMLINQLLNPGSMKEIQNASIAKANKKSYLVKEV